MYWRIMSIACVNISDMNGKQKENGKENINNFRSFAHHIPVCVIFST